MTPKLIAAISILGAMPAFAQGTPAKPTVQDVQKVVQIITSDKAKTAAYCELEKLETELADAQEKKDAKKVEELEKRTEALEQKLGPEYAKLMTAMETVDPDSPDGESLQTAFDPLEKLCPK